MYPVTRIAVLLATTTMLGACTSLPRLCAIEGNDLDGLEHDLARGRTVKVLVVHGIGRHAPDHANGMADRLASMMELDGPNESEQHRFRLLLPEAGPERLGPATLDIYRYRSAKLASRLEVFGLGWSGLTRRSRVVTEFDHLKGVPGFHNTANKRWKSSFAGRLYDVAHYVGASKEQLLAAVSETICWMLRSSPFESDLRIRNGNLPLCTVLAGDRYSHVEKEEYAIITHSLGSDIVLRGVEWLGRRTKSSSLAERLRHKTVKMFMLSNQIPLLDTAQDNRQGEITSRRDEFCRQSGTRHDERWLSRLAIAAFTDTNDWLSYRLTPTFVEDNVDSRLCPEVRNVYTTVSDEFSLAALAVFLPGLFVDATVAAHPIGAHTGYLDDDRVLSMIVRGIRTSPTPATPARPCQRVQIPQRDRISEHYLEGAG